MALESNATVYEDSDSLTYIEEDTHKANVSASELAHTGVPCSHMFSIFPCVIHFHISTLFGQ
jgi:hypothetical protein